MTAHCAGAVFGNYELVRPIGSGGMGAVYEGRHRTLGRRVAVKVLTIKAADAERAEVATSRFQREGRTAAQVQHRHIVDVFDFGVEDGVPFLVMELVDGETLAQLLEREGPLPLSRLVEIALPVVSAVAELHAAGIVHRDLKPANVLLSRDREGELWPKVADFGVSRMDDGTPGLTDSGVVLGTLEYMSPEQARASREATELTDQYALGVMLYECATGVVPFKAAALYDMLHAIVTASLPAPSTLRPALPEAFDALVLRAMNRDPDARFRCLEDLGAALLPFATREVAARWASEFVSPSLREPFQSAPALTSERTIVAAKPRRRVPLWGAGAVVTALLAFMAVRAVSSTERRAPELALAQGRSASTAPVLETATPSVEKATPSVEKATPPAETAIVAAPAVSAFEAPATSPASRTPVTAARAPRPRVATPTSRPASTARSTQAPLDNGAPVIDAD